MTRRRVEASSVVVLLVALSGCGGDDLSVSGRDACNAVASWISEGAPADRKSDVVSRVESSIEEAEAPALEESLAALRAASTDDAADAADEFRQTCADLGWELPEG